MWHNNAIQQPASEHGRAGARQNEGECVRDCERERWREWECACTRDNQSHWISNRRPQRCQRVEEDCQTRRTVFPDEENSIAQHPTKLLSSATLSTVRSIHPSHSVHPVHSVHSIRFSHYPLYPLYPLQPWSLGVYCGVTEFKAGLGYLATALESKLATAEIKG
ncbi:hypothetical protein GQ42DRAFT_91710 [Ramicandelaber brevisporus]|nr:hypothetical protein GQ42DRAFT_91710 [Ramicandelaber brevisporus]